VLYIGAQCNSTVCCSHKRMGSYASKHSQMTVCDVHHMYNMHDLLYIHMIYASCLCA